jgi:hypothetical protein
MAKASKKHTSNTPKKESKYHKRFKIDATPDEVLKKMLQASIKKEKK